MKKTAKRLCALALCLVMVFALAACGQNEGGESPSEAEEKYTIGIVQQIDNGAFSDMRGGFISRLRGAGYTEDKCEILERNAQGDATTLNTIISDLAAAKVDMIVTIATPATLAAVGAELDIPTIFIAVSDPIGTGIIEDWDKITNNATGTANPIPIEKIFRLSDNQTIPMTDGIFHVVGNHHSRQTMFFNNLIGQCKHRRRSLRVEGSRVLIQKQQIRFLQGCHQQGDRLTLSSGQKTDFSSQAFFQSKVQLP